MPTTHAVTDAVAEVMSTRLVTVGPETTAAEAHAVMEQHGTPGGARPGRYAP